MATGPVFSAKPIVKMFASSFYFQAASLQSTKVHELNPPTNFFNRKLISSNVMHPQS